MSNLFAFSLRPTGGIHRSVQLALAVLLVLTLVVGTVQPVAAAKTAVPTFTIVRVDPGKTVTIRTSDFPANQTFTVRMGEMGTRGANGTVVATLNSGGGGSFEATFEIPAALQDDKQVAIRLDSPQGYYAYNWFDNVVAGSTPAPAGTPAATGTPAPTATAAPASGTNKGIPTFKITSVAKDQTVTVTTSNFPANQTFTVRMGEYGTLGVGGTVAGTVDSGKGGAFEATFTIPAGLKGKDRIAVRMDSPQGYYAYNWFYNQAGTAANPAPGATATPAAGSATATPAATKPAGYTGIPTFSIQSVVEGKSVTVLTNNFPANQTFTVRMGDYGTRGVGGTVVGTLDSGKGGAFNATFDIPAALQNRDRIAIRMDSPQGYYAYNWFDNGGTEVVRPTASPAAATATPAAGTATATPAPSTSSIPTITIVKVVGDESVTIRTNNFPANQTFTARMGKFGTRGVNGTVVGTVDSGKGGAFEATFEIPEGLQGEDQIAIRLDAPAGYYAFNWFWNSSN